MTDPKPRNPYLRKIYDLRMEMEQAILTGNLTDKSVGEVGLQYAMAQAKYATLRRLEDEFKEMINNGDTLNDE